MAIRLTQAEIEAYRSRGYVFPVPVLAGPEVERCRADLARTEALVGGALAGRHNQKPHLLFPWLADLVRHPKVLDAVQDVIGPDILCWGSQFFSKGANDPGFVSWHQDGTYWGLSSQEVVTAWIALTPSTRRTGCMRVVPGTHLMQVPHSDTFAPDNLLSRGQEIAVEVADEDAVDIVLAPGEMSLHHVLLFHGSEPNRANHPRIGFAVRYVPTHVSQLTGERDSATLVRGADRHKNFDHEQVPSADLDPAAVAHHAAVLERQLAILYRGSAGKGKLAHAASS